MIDYKTEYKATLETINTLTENRTEKGKLEVALGVAIKASKDANEVYQLYVEAGQDLLTAKEEANLAVSMIHQKIRIHRAHVLELVYVE